MHRTRWQQALAVGMLALAACDDRPATDQPPLQATRQGLTAWDVDRTLSQAESLAESHYASLLGTLDSAIQGCLSGMGVSATTLSVSCESTPIQSNYATPYPLIDGDPVGGECYWKCKIEVPSQGMTYDSILILKELLAPSEVSGGC